METYTARVAACYRWATGARYVIFLHHATHVLTTIHIQRLGSELEVRNSVDIECFCINTLHSYFINPSWDLFLSRVGKELHTSLLCDTISCCHHRRANSATHFIASYTCPCSEWFLRTGAIFVHILLSCVHKY